jgi:hypothetical protein
MQHRITHGRGDRTGQGGHGDTRGGVEDHGVGSRAKHRSPECSGPEHRGPENSAPGRDSARRYARPGTHNGTADEP